MRHLFHFSGLCIGSALLIASCQQSSETLKPQNIIKGPNVSVINGRIKLDSEQDFIKTINALKEMPEVDRSEWDKNNGIVSMQEFYNQHKEGFPLGEVNPVFKTTVGDKPYLGDFLFTRMVNEEGVLQIGNDVYTFDLDGKRLKTEAKTFDKTQKTALDAVSNISTYSVKLLGDIGTDKDKGVRKMTPDLLYPAKLG